MPKRAAALTAKEVEAATSEGKTQRDRSDGLCPGLVLRIAKTGRKTWVVRYKANGTRNRSMKIGTYPNTSLADARKRAREVLGQAEDGEDPAQEREDRRAGRGTFGEMAEEILTKELEPRLKQGSLRESTLREWKRILESELLPAWRHQPAGEISRREVRTLAEKIAGRGSPAMADRVVSFVNFLFNRALDREFPNLVGNPAHRMKLAWEDKGRDRYLTAEEIKAVWKAASEDIPGVGWAFQLALLTGQRMGSVAAMRWDGIEVKKDGGLWTIPPEHFKGKRTHLVPLSEEAWEVIGQLRETPASETWVFPSRPPARKPYLQAWNRALERIRDRSEVPDWTVHDFRTTFRTHAVRAPEDEGLEVPAHVADAVLGHKEASLGFGRYTGDKSRYLLHEKREALAAWGRFIRKAVEVEND